MEWLLKLVQLIYINRNKNKVEMINYIFRRIFLLKTYNTEISDIYKFINIPQYWIKTAI